MQILREKQEVQPDLERWEGEGGSCALPPPRPIVKRAPRPTRIPRFTAYGGSRRW